MSSFFEEWSDAFDNQLSLGTINEGNLEGHYTYSPERLRVFVNGNRQFLQYTDVSDPFSFSGVDQYSRGDDFHTLSPQSDGEVVTLETTQRYRYVVQYIIEWSFAFSFSQNLQSGDVFTAGFGDSDLENASSNRLGPAADGWFIVKEASMPDKEADLVEVRDGVEKEKRRFSFVNLPTKWGRIGGATNWYNVGTTKIEETYSRSTGNNVEQVNETLSSIGVADGKGPINGNKPVQFSIKSGSDSAGSLDIDIGSIGVRTLGNVKAILRDKVASIQSVTIDTTGSWIPIHAVRVDPERALTYVRLQNTNVLKYSASNDVQVLAQSFSPEKLRDANGNSITDSDFSTPEIQSTQGSVLEETSAVEQFPDNTGSITTSTTNPGGYQIGYSSLYTTGNSTNAGKAESNQQNVRHITDRDICVFLAKSPSTGEITFEYRVEQDW